jgi:hypothetical protein
LKIVVGAYLLSDRRPRVKAAIGRVTGLLCVAFAVRLVTVHQAT